MKKLFAVLAISIALAAGILLLPSIILMVIDYENFDGGTISFAGNKAAKLEPGSGRRYIVRLIHSTSSIKLSCQGNEDKEFGYISTGFYQYIYLRLEKCNVAELDIQLYP